MDYEEFEAPKRKKGFFERIFGSSDEPRARKKKTRKSDDESSSIY
jgi:hypothetical protein